MRGDKFLISTQSYRHEYDSEVEIPTQYGYLIETDFNGFFRKLEIPTKTDSPYGERIKPGLRGLYSFDGKIYVCTWNKVYIIDYDSFCVTDSFDHPLMADLHGVYVDEGGIWVTSSLIDSVLSFGWDYNLRGVLTFCDTPLYPKRERKKIDISKDYRLRGKLERGFQNFHANHIMEYGEKYLLITGRGKGDSGGRVLLVDRVLKEYRLWFSGLNGPHDGIFLPPDLFVFTETNGSSVAILKRRRFLKPKIVSRLYMPHNVNKYWTRGLAADTKENLLVGRSVWQGDKDNRYASVVQISQDGAVVREHRLEIDDYPECRIYQIILSP